MNILDYYQSAHMNILDYYQSAQMSGLEPTLLEFHHPLKGTPLSICGISPLYTLRVTRGRLYKNNQDIGPALDIFKHVNHAETKAESAQFFPAFLGYFSYEFAEHFDLAVHAGERLFPDAYFRFYHKGLVIDDGQVIHHDHISGKLPPCDAWQFQHLIPGMNQAAFLQAVETIKETIQNGDVYQVNLSMPFFFDKQVPTLALYKAMLASNPSPFMGLIEHDDCALICGSPERLFSHQDDRLITRPIAGTKRRGENSSEDELIRTELRTCPKENAEHAMLVDLLRNDMHKVCETSVVIDEDRSVEFYSHVMHLVSQVSGTCRRSLGDVVPALFPGGTITGAPKPSVMKCIADLEQTPRGPYTGSLGYISTGFGTDFNIIIRSVVKAHNTMFINSGAGIVIDSIPENEWSEINRKAEFIKDILQNKTTKKSPQKTILGPPITKEQHYSFHTDKRVLFIENNDSFSFNIIAAMRCLGAHIIIADPDLKNTDDITHVVIGPGPGNPENLPELMSAIATIVEKKIPLLGICLGHQAIGHYFGGSISKRIPIHGKSVPITHHQEGLFKGLSSPTFFTRYHSLSVGRAPANFNVDAFSHDDCIMAMSHNELPIFGVQFHPESYLSENNNLILSNFLETTWPR